MIHCIVDITVKPESLEKVGAVLRKMVDYSSKEDGCLYLELFENVQDKFQLALIEIWTSNDAFEVHLHSEHIQKASFDIYSDITRPPNIKRYKSIQLDSNIIKTSSRFCTLI